jgi:hypothetical protein
MASEMLFLLPFAFSLSLSLSLSLSQFIFRSNMKLNLHLFLQSVNPHLSLGGEVFWAGQHRKSGVGYAARYETDKMVMWLGFHPLSLV